MNKRELTALALREAGEPSESAEVEKFLRIWWVAPFSPIGFRLTYEGRSFFKHKANITSYQFKVKEYQPRGLKLMLLMNKYLQSPFYINNQNITLFGETDATMIGLYGGDIELYLNNFEK